MGMRSEDPTAGSGRTPHMTPLSQLMTHFRDRVGRSDEGATMVEYGLMIALIAIVALVAVEMLGVGVTDIFQESCDELTGAVCTP